jgi:hypothetical protein
MEISLPRKSASASEPQLAEQAACSEPRDCAPHKSERHWRGVADAERW